MLPMLHCAAVKKSNHHIKAFTMLVVIGLMFATQTWGTPPAQAQDPASEIFQLVNNFRASLGLPAFTWNSQLAAASQTQANWMIANPNSYVHTWPDGTTKEDRARAQGYNGRVVENIVGGWNMTPQRALTWWQNSPPHYNTITSSFYVEAGTAFAGSGNQRRYVIVVGNRGAAPAVAVSSQPEPEPIIVAPIVLVEPDANGQILHVAGQGHALWTLAAYYDVDVADLLLYNNMRENDLVSVGDEIIIQPARDWVPPPTPTPPYSVFVGEGQTLWTIAAIHKVDLADILLFNGLGPDALISEGDEIKIRLRPGESPPTPTPTATPVQRYAVREGDTAWSIAARFGISLDELLVWNQLPADPILSIGTELWVVSPSLATQSDTGALVAADLLVTPTAETVTEATVGQSASDVTAEAIPPNTPQPTPTPAPTNTPEGQTVASLSDVAQAETVDEAAQTDVVVVTDDAPRQVLNLPLILGGLALIFLGIGGWLFIQSRRIKG